MSKRWNIPVVVLLLAAGWFLNHAYQHVAETHPARQADPSSVQGQQEDAPSVREGFDKTSSTPEPTPAPADTGALQGGRAAAADSEGARVPPAGRDILPEGVVEVMADNPWRGIPEARIRWDGGGTLTDSQGRAPLPPLPPTAAVTVSARGYLPAKQRRGQGETLTVTLNRAASEIQVIDAQTLDPVPGAVLRLRTPDGGERVLSMADGIAVVDWHAMFPEAEEPADGMVVSADAPGYLPVKQRIVSEPVAVSGERIPDPLVMLELVPDSIEGFVSDGESGAPIPGAVVHFHTERVATSADGTFSLLRRRFSEGEQSGLRIEAEGYSPKVIQPGRVPEATADAPAWMDVELTPAADAQH